MGLRGDHPVYFFLVAYVSGLLLSSASLFLFGWVAGLALPVILVPFLLKRFWAKGGLLYWVALLLGGLRMGFQDPVWDSKHYLNVPVQEVYLLESRGEAEERAKTYRVKMEVVAGGIDSVWREMRGLVQVYLPKGDTLAASVRHGDRLFYDADDPKFDAAFNGVAGDAALRAVSNAGERTSDAVVRDWTGPRRHEAGTEFIQSEAAK